MYRTGKKITFSENIIPRGHNSVHPLCILLVLTIRLSKIAGPHCRAKGQRNIPAADFTHSERMECGV